MHLIESPDLDLFREEVREWLYANAPKETRPHGGQAMRDFDLAWQRTQFDGGWAGIAWPAEFGGRGLSLIQQLIWSEEYSRSPAPYMGSMFIALSHAGPTLINCGTPEQNSFHLTKILKGEAIWCQGFSEPGSGSDLSSLKCRAELDGDHLVVNGTKIWNSFADVADYQELLVRTDNSGKKHQGISWVICDMKLPGVDVRPIKAMSGPNHFSQVFYDNVRIPLDQVVGEINNGWKVAMTTLGFERGTATIGHQIHLAKVVDEMIEIANTIEAPSGGRKAIQDESIAAELAQLKAEVAALRSMTALSISRGLHNPVPGAEGNLVALYFCEATRRIHQAGLTLLGGRGLERSLDLSDGESWAYNYLDAFKWAIGGGTSEIRRNTIGERLLGLPKYKVA
jgi:alkylation response protein AidB-like acyl-CoA dehydrogenase